MNTTTNFSGKNILITGASSGIGYAAAIEFAKQGANVIGIGRNPTRCQKALMDIRSKVPDAKIQFLVADLSSQSQVRNLAKTIQETIASLENPWIDALVNNAGTYSQNKVMTNEGIELTFATNHLASFLLTELLFPLLQSSPMGRVVNVSSNSHYSASIDPDTAGNPSFYFGLQAYARSKLANILFAKEFNRRHKDSGIRAFSMDPGLVKTDIALKGQPLFSRIVWKIRSAGGVDPEVPVTTILLLAGDESIQNSPEIYWYDGKPKKCKTEAEDPQLGKKLWEVSCRLCGIDITEGGE